jgi:ferredoxin-NADP reductase
MEFINWIQDVREHLRVSRRRKALRQPGQGVDYTQQKYRDVVRQVVAGIHPKRMKLRVVEIVQETPSSKTFRCERIDGPLPPFRPGQYVNLFVDVDGVLTSRPYSISSPPQNGGLLALTVRDNPGGFVAPYLLNEVQVGDELESTGPAGHFYHEPLIDGDDLVFLAGGSGVTPFRSIIRDALTRGLPLKMHLLYGSRVPDDVIYGEEMTELAASHANFTYSLVISEPPPDYGGPTGFLDAALIREQVGDVAGKTFYICGPPVMYDFCLAALTELGVPSHKIRRELFGPPTDITQEPGWPEGLAGDAMFEVQIEGRETIQAPAAEPLMNTLERYGIVVPAVCRTGTCSACRARLLSGQVFMPARTALRESDRAYGYIHTCMSYPVENLRVRL